MRNVYHSLGHLYTGSPVGGTVWGGLWAVALLWGECHWKWTLRVFKDACHLEFAPLLSTCVWRCEFSPSVPGIAAVFCYRVFLPWWNPSSGMIRPNKLSLLLLVLVLMFYPSNKKNNQCRSPLQPSFTFTVIQWPLGTFRQGFPYHTLPGLSSNLKPERKNSQSLPTCIPHDSIANTTWATLLSLVASLEWALSPLIPLAAVK